jgi:hypothetical protein
VSDRHILSEKFVDCLDEDLAELAMSHDSTVSREAQRLRTLINASSLENGGPAALSDKEYEALVILLRQESQA